MEHYLQLHRKGFVAEFVKIGCIILFASSVFAERISR